jgi:hypothetical protein
VLALDGESLAGMLVGFASRFDLSLPLVRGEIEVARRLAKRELSQALAQNASVRLERDRALTRAWQAE